MCREDVALIIKNVLFSKSSDELVDMVQDKSEPMIVRLMVRRAYLEGFQEGRAGEPVRFAGQGLWESLSKT